MQFTSSGPHNQAGNEVTRPQTRLAQNGIHHVNADEAQMLVGCHHRIIPFFKYQNSRWKPVYDGSMRYCRVTA